MITKDTFKTLHIPENFSYDFWNNASQIKAYCEGVLALYPHTKNIKIAITISGGEAFVQKFPNIVSITIPRISLTNDDSYKLKNIVARTAFLRHELAHIIYTNLNQNLQDKTFAKYVKLFNIMEDIRIENLFARDFKGTFNLFRSLYKAIYYSNLEDYQKYFKDITNVYSFGYYCRVREKRLRVSENAFNDLYEKYRFIFYIEDYKTFYNYVLEIIQHFEKLKPQQDEEQSLQDFLNQQIDASKDQQEQDSDSSGDESQNYEEQEQNSTEHDQDDYGDTEKEQDSEISEDAEANETHQQKSKDENESGEDSKESEIDEDLDQDYSTEQDSKSLPSAKLSDGKEQENDSEEDQDSIDDEPEEDDIVSTLLQEDLEDNKKINNFDINSILKDISNQTEIFDFQQYEFNPNDFESATIINYHKIIPHINFISKNGINVYRSVVNKHKKTITETINYLKLKLKIRNKDKILNWQVDGKLDQKNIKEILINKESPNVFFQNIKNIKAESEFYLMIDFSGSMGGDDRRNAVVTAIILIEICKALNIKYDINFFAGTELIIYNTKNSDAVIRCLINDGLTQDNINIKISNRTGEVKSIQTKTAGKIVAKLKSINEPHSATIESIFGSLIDPEKRHNINFISGGTPEFQSVLGLIKANNHKTSCTKNLFIINDGSFHAIQELYEINKINFNKQVVTIDLEYFKKIDFKDLNRHILKTYKSIIEFNVKLQKERGNTFDLSRIGSILNKNIFVNPDAYNLSNLQNYGTGNKIHIIYGQAIGLTYMDDWMVDNYAFFDIGVYKKMIEYAKKKNFNIYGFGIRSDLGKAYIGDRFTVFRNSEEIKNDFALKVRQVF